MEVCELRRSNSIISSSKEKKKKLCNKDRFKEIRIMDIINNENLFSTGHINIFIWAATQGISQEKYDKVTFNCAIADRKKPNDFPLYSQAKILR